jgi:tetratricopeptide (TPR) repeat protein|tara:strand:- start:1492 stop:2886 length:1395 start_codon:yes stop_codon:yes gene_type:complete
MDNLINKNVVNLINRAQISKAAGQLLQAKIILNKAIKLDPKNEIALNNIANIYKETKDFDKSIKYYLKSITANSSYKIAKINLAILYHEINKLNEAEKVYKEIINIDKLNFGIYFKLSNINFSYFNEDVIQFIKDSIKKKDLSLYNKACGYFILAEAEKIKKNFKKEFNYLNQGHEYFYKSNVNVYNQSLLYWLEIIPKKFNEIKFLNKNTNEFSKKINPIFIIGLPRSGSTLVEGIISSGLIKIENGGETAIINAEIIKKVRDKKFDKNFAKIKFDLDLNNLSNSILARYENLKLLHKDKNYFFTDKSLENFFYVELILNLFPNAKFINCERDLIDSIFAIYGNFFDKMSWTHSIKNILKYIDQYLIVIGHFKKKYPKKIYSVQLKDLTNNSFDISKQLFKFCQLDWDKSSLEFYKRKNFISKTASNIQIRKKIYKYDTHKYKVYKEFLRDYSNTYPWLKQIL